MDEQAVRVEIGKGPGAKEHLAWLLRELRRVAPWQSEREAWEAEVSGFVDGMHGWPLVLTWMSPRATARYRQGYADGQAKVLMQGLTRLAK